MKVWVVIGILFGCAQFASAGESQFHLVTRRCQPEAASEVETTPQSPPLHVDDPATPGCNRWEINALFDGDIAKSESSWDLPLLDINYGFGDNLQLKYEVPYVSNQADDSSLHGVGASKLGVKLKFYDNEAAELQIATYPQVEFITPGSGSVEKGLATAGTVTTIPLLMSKKLGSIANGDVVMTANVGYNFTTHEASANFVSAAAGVGFPAFRKLAVMGELSTEQALNSIGEGPRESLLRANVGLMTTVSRQLMVYGAFGRSLYASDDLSHTYVLAGVRLLAGGGYPATQE